MGERRIVNGFIYEKSADGRIVPVGPAQTGIQTRGPDQRLPGQVQGQNLSNQKAAIDIGNAPLERTGQVLSNQKTAQEIALDRSKVGIGLSQQYASDGRVKAYRDVLPQITGAMAAPDNAQGDLAVIYAFSKSMDPGSAVRGEETEMAKQTASLLGRVDAMIASVQSGNRLPGNVRRQLIDTMREKGNQYNLAYSEARKQYTGLASEAGLNPDIIIGPHDGAKYQQVEANYKGAPVVNLDGSQGASPTTRSGPPEISLGNLDQGPDRLRMPGVEAATGDTVTEPNPQLSADIDQLIRMNRPTREIINYIKEQGGSVNPQTVAAINQSKQYLKQNPGYKGGFGQATNTRPTTQMEQDASSPVSAFLNNLSPLAPLHDEAAGGISALMGGDYTQGRDAFEAGRQLINEESPDAAFAGQLLGGIGGGLGAYAGARGLAGAGNRFLAKAGEGLSAKGGMGADVLYGTGYGAAQDNENRLRGGAIGGGAAAAGSLLGQGLANGVAAGISPSGGQLGKLYEMGARPSLGQRFDWLNPIEQYAQSLPIVGPFIKGTRQNARDAAERGIFNQALGNVGEKLPDNVPLGAQAHRYKQGVESREYDAIRAGMTVAPDGQFGQDFGAIQQQVMGLRDESKKAFERIFKGSVARRFRNGTMTGADFKEAQRELGQRIRSIRSNQTGDGELADAFEAVSVALDGSARRNSAPELGARLDAADKMYAEGVLIDRASAYTGGEPGRMTPSQYKRAVKQESGGVRGRQFNAGKSLNYDLAEQFAKLGDPEPNPTTADRLLQSPLGIGGITGLNMMDPTGISQAATGLSAGYGLLNAPGVRGLTTGMFAPRRSQLLQDLAEKTRRLGGPLGGAGAGAGLAYSPLLYPLLPSQ